MYRAASEAGTRIQHILYGPDCVATLREWHADGTVPPAMDGAMEGAMDEAILVLGRYDPPTDGAPDELPALAALAEGLRLTVCCFGRGEQASLLAAARMGMDVRIGFENNLLAPDGTPWRDNAAAVTALRNDTPYRCYRPPICRLIVVWRQLTRA